ncbi:hypothetical protein SAMN05421848_1600 [Kushneria avicenniae]|uniref:Uncharacterized protein n=1 Tax=Kushneria avicenniae TaxID=402385 RepID=A0A1I1JTI3_9GAMM|nr:hypothetical protein [Kushneria avicenniae]SFC48680.1 hypothetical protein SAMN05421848_1600 [Kushneria avicenniae]
MTAANANAQTTTTADTQTGAAPMANHMTRHEQARNEYLSQRETLTDLHQRVERFSKGAAASREEAESNDRRWRDLLRESNGDLTKEIRQVKRSVSESRETAEELESMAGELQAPLTEQHIAVIDARRKYEVARQEAWGLEVEQAFENATAALLDLPEGRHLLSLLPEVKRKTDHDVKSEPNNQEHGPADHRARVEQEQAKRFQQKLVKRLMGLNRQIDPAQETPPAPESLTVLRAMSLLACEQQYSGPKNSLQQRAQNQAQELQRQKTH